MKQLRRLIPYSKKILLVFSILFLFYISMVYRTDTHTIAIKRNILSGTLSIDSIPGIEVAAPWILVSRIDITPQRVCIESGSNIINCILIQFIASEYEEFVRYEGFYYYWWNNRISFNMSYDRTYRGVIDLLRIHGYGKNPPKFIRVLSE